jgi:hypothetical protein
MLARRMMRMPSDIGLPSGMKHAHHPSPEISCAGRYAANPRREIMRFSVDRIFLVLAAAVLIAGCSGYRASYDIGLVKAVRPGEAEAQFGTHDIKKVQEDGPDQSFFEDGLVKIVWIPTAEEIAFELTNQTSQSITIRWEDAKFIDDSGSSHRIIRSTVDYAKADEPQEATVVEGDGSLQEAIFPADNLFYSDLRWQRKPIFQTFAMSRKAEHFEEDVQENIGKSFDISLPLEVGGKVHEYIFSFKVANVIVQK